jgi:hypothetical protein
MHKKSIVLAVITTTSTITILSHCIFVLAVAGSLFHPANVSTGDFAGHVVHLIHEWLTVINKTLPVVVFSQSIDF